MARNVFSVTTPASTARLDSGGHAEVSFTVSNISGQALRGRARVFAADPNQAKWFKISGDAERDFAPNGTQQYTVQLTTPPGATVGKYSFRLDVFSIELPDEEYTQGPNIGFEIAGPPTPQKRSFPWWIIPVVIVAILAIAGVTVYVTHPWSRGPGPTPVPIVTPASTPTPKPTPTPIPSPTPSPLVTIPNVVGLNVETAARVLQSLGLKVDEVKTFGAIGYVISTYPPAGTTVPRGDT